MKITTLGLALFFSFSTPLLLMGMDLPALEPVFFDVDKAEIKDPPTIEHHAKWLLENRDKVVILEGHCDEWGDHNYNLQLGDKRARAVMKALMEKGVPETQLIIVSYGETRPVDKRPSDSGWAKNRRVEFVVR